MQDPGPSSNYYGRFASTSSGPIRPPSPPSSPLLPARADHMASASSESLYALLNLPTTCSPADIKERYRALAAVYHPDKQRDDGARAAAHRAFQEIQRAYEVLIDTQTRAVYDLFGEEGLRTSWEVGPRNMTPEQIRAHFQSQAYVKRELEADALVKAKGDFSVVLDARAVFLPRSFFRDPSSLSHGPIARLARVRPGQTILRHSFETPLTDHTQLVWDGTLAARHGAGGANVAGTLKHQFSPRLWASTSQAVLGVRANTTKATFTIDENTYVTGTSITQTLAAPPRLSLTVGRRLWPETTGFITFKSGFYALGAWGAALAPETYLSDRSALSVGLTTARRDGSGWTVETTTGLVDNALSADWATRVAGLTLKLGAAADLAGGISAFVDGTAKVTEHARAGVMLQVQMKGGVQLRLKFARLGQKVSIPILLAPDLNPYVVLASTVVPASAYAALHHFYLLPRKRRRIAARIDELRDEHKDYIEQKRQEALDAVALMERAVAQRASAEREKGGLVILSAHYGPAASFTPRGHVDGPAVLDVTVPVQALVANSRLYVPGGRGKHALLGFYDPCIGESKRLRVRYLFRDREHVVDVDDAAPLRAPVKAHALEGP
ncbi:hypothetical protein Q5752_001028 [Cryptotrichosporon argae]